MSALGTRQDDLQRLEWCRCRQGRVGTELTALRNLLAKAAIDLSAGVLTFRAAGLLLICTLYSGCVCAKVV
jgi:hypothetical protein